LKAEFLLLFEEQDCEVHSHGQVHSLQEGAPSAMGRNAMVPENWLVVPSCLGRAFDTIHLLAQFSPKEAGVLHRLVLPEMAIHLEDAGIKTAAAALWHVQLLQ
jgi:hypothetical protein